ncbi:MAG: hypothetical protein ABIP44_03855, partial [Pseudoxanthomonas sp.]
MNTPTEDATPEHSPQAESLQEQASEEQAPSEHAQPGEHAVLALERFLPYRLSILSNHISQTISG